MEVGEKQKREAGWCFQSNRDFSGSKLAGSDFHTNLNFLDKSVALLKHGVSRQVNNHFRGDEDLSRMLLNSHQSDETDPYNRGFGGQTNLILAPFLQYSQ